MEMKINFYLIFTVLYQIMLCDADVIQSIWEIDAIGSDSVFTNGVLFTTDAESTIACILICRMRSDCNGISFEESNLRCTAYDIRQLDIFTPKAVTSNTVFYVMSPASSNQCGETFPDVAGVKIPQRICRIPGCALSYVCAEGYNETSSLSDRNGFCQEDGNYSLPQINCSACALGSNFVEIPGRYFDPLHAPGASSSVYSTFGYLYTASDCQNFCISLTTASYVCKVAYYWKNPNDWGHCIIWSLRVEDNPTLYSQYLTYNASYTEFVRTCL